MGGVLDVLVGGKQTKTRILDGEGGGGQKSVMLS